ncbi:zinc-finger of monoamine-oxidase A repressor R1 [Trifolium medium]|uniref:Zinc-finger of monoamine-oxidase A repressor R1 n=1 Tax=Trifolium medium TaxID=97028 RepID=A0A392QPF0_9FABA|nr:zinc-finger of monoamine-oxidase A repressor R1 [Trifolium medium]
MKGKSLGRPKALKIGHEKAKTEFQGTVVIVGGTGDNDGDESQINPTLLRAEKIVEEIPLPTGIEMKKILEFEFPPEDIGNVLQFLEFCRVFGKFTAAI